MSRGGQAKSSGGNDSKRSAAGAEANSTAAAAQAAVELDSKIRSQGNVVRNLKSKKADKVLP